MLFTLRTGLAISQVQQSKYTIKAINSKVIKALIESIIIIKDSEAIKGKMMDEVSGETSYSRNIFNSFFQEI